MEFPRSTESKMIKTSVILRPEETKEVENLDLDDEPSPSGSFVSGNNRIGNTAFDDKKEDDWEKLSRISRRTAQNKKPVNLDTIEDKIKTLHTLQIDMGRKKTPGIPFLIQAMIKIELTVLS